MRRSLCSLLAVLLAGEAAERTGYKAHRERAPVVRFSGCTATLDRQDGKMIDSRASRRCRRWGHQRGRGAGTSSARHRRHRCRPQGVCGVCTNSLPPCLSAVQTGWAVEACSTVGYQDRDAVTSARTLVSGWVAAVGGSCVRCQPGDRARHRRHQRPCTSHRWPAARGP